LEIGIDMRVMGLDYGSKTVGVAVSDELMLTAQGIEIIRRERETKLRRTYARIEELVRDYKVDRIVLGYPRNMDNSEGERCRMVREFGSNVKRRTGLPVILWDERLTTVAAQRSMDETGVRESDRKKYVDEIAAMFILQGYMDSLAASGEETARSITDEDRRDG
jgi:putative Holliday junction resolvase